MLRGVLRLCLGFWGGMGFSLGLLERENSRELKVRESGIVDKGGACYWS